MKMCIYGAGAIGGLIGAHLARSGEDVTLMMREAKPRRFRVVANGKPVANAIVEYARPLFVRLGPEHTEQLVARHALVARASHQRQQRKPPRLRGGASEALPLTLHEQPAERIEA